MKTDVLLVLLTVLVALIFDFLNGFHDSANSIATVVSTRVLSPKLAVLWAAVFNFLAAFFLGTAVAKTIGKGMIRLEDVTQYVVMAGLFGAIVWDVLTWWWGLPGKRLAPYRCCLGVLGHHPARLVQDTCLHCGRPCDWPSSEPFFYDSRSLAAAT